MAITQKTLFRVVVAFLVAAGLSACGPSLEEFPLEPGIVGMSGANHPTTMYRLGPGDRVAIKVFGQKDLSGEFEVDGGGQIAYPLLGQVTAGGHTVDELRAVIADDLNRDFVIEPQVNIEVLNFRPFYILGQVNAPGSYPYVNGLNVRQAIAVAGGFTRRAGQSKVILVREESDGIRRFRATLNVPVLPGDTIEVERRLF